MVLLAVADDFSGANDCAASFFEQGFSAYAALGLGLPSPRPQALVLNTETRFSSASESRRRSREAWNLLRNFGRLVSYQRMDSTLRGHPGEQILGLFEALSPPRLAFCAAYPAQGRQIREGIVRVRGLRLDQSEYALDPLSPPQTAEPVKLFEKGLAAGLPMAPLAGLRKSIRRCGARILCFDAATDADLRILAKACLAEGIRHFAGASGFSSAIARELSPGKERRRPAPSLPCAIVAGSVSQTSLDQLQRLEASGLAPCYDLESGVPQGSLKGSFALSSLRQRSQLRLPRGTALRRKQADLRIRRLVQEALRLGGPAESRLWMLTGGHTATEFYEALGLCGNWVRGSLFKGMALLEAVRKGRKSVFTCTKPGGFGAPDTMERFMRARFKS